MHKLIAMLVGLAAGLLAVAQAGTSPVQDPIAEAFAAACQDFAREMNGR